MTFTFFIAEKRYPVSLEEFIGSDSKAGEEERGHGG